VSPVSGSTPTASATASGVSAHHGDPGTFSAAVISGPFEHKPTAVTQVAAELAVLSGVLVVVGPVPPGTLRSVRGLTAETAGLVQWGP
jgi:hypothetical protein